MTQSVSMRLDEVLNKLDILTKALNGRVPG
jgi:hypothetical protein